MPGLSRETFAQYVTENQNKFYRLAYSYAGNEQDALDIVQDAVERALSRLGTVREPEYLRTWFYRVLVNECLTFLRRNRARVQTLPLPEELPGPESAPPDAAELRARIERLPPELKSVVFLRFYEDMKLVQVAESTGTNLNTAKARLYRALKLLRLEMEAEDEE
jgi:RNA polymerase sigma-70 factor (ECF subfamily)